MSVDREYRIRIVTRAEGDGASKTSEGLKETGEAAEKAAISHHALHGAMRALANQMREIPIVGHLLHAVFNPLSLLIVSVGAAIEIFKHKWELLANSELPPNSPMSPGHVDALTQAWNKFADAVHKVAVEQQSVAMAAAAAAKAFEQQVERMKMLHPEAKAQIDIDAEQVKRKMDAETATALEKEAAAKMKQAGNIKVASAEDDATSLASYKANADAAKKDQEESEERLRKLRSFQAGEMQPTEKHAYGLEYLYHYGMGSPEDAAKMEEGKIKAAQAPQEAYRKRLASANDRDRLRAERDRLVSEATASQSKAVEIRAGLNRDSELKEVVDIEDLVGHGATINSAQKQSLAHLQALLRSSGWSQQQIVQILSDMRDQTRTLEDRLNQLKTSMHGTITP